MIRNSAAAPVARDEFSKNFIDSVTAATDIIKLISQVVDIKPSGDNFFGLCPFHGEKSPSFSVSSSKQFFHCFGCGKNGDSIDFLMEHAGLSFRESVTELASNARIPLPQSEGGSKPIADLSKMIRTNEIAANFFRHCLKHTDLAKKYLKERRITAEATKRFIIGYAPEGWQSLQEAFEEYKTDQTIIDLGLVISKEDRRYDRFRQRIMFGIRDARGRLLGFGGRVIDKSEPKYLNSPQSDLFDKGGTLFGIFEAREGIRQFKQVIVTEGYMDTIANSMAGITQTVATMGTACTNAQIERLIALSSEIIFSFDGDKAGVAAAWKALNNCLPYATDDRSFRFFLLPNGMDPDELIKAEGVESYKQKLSQSLTLSGFILTHLAQNNNNLETAENRAKFLTEGTALIQRLPKGGNLFKILKAELEKSSLMSTETISALSREAAKNNPVVSQNKRKVWIALTAAVIDQPKTAAEYADQAIDELPSNLIDAFFNKDIDLLEDYQQPFWKALLDAILYKDPKDTQSDICLAQRDLISNFSSVIKKEMGKEKANQVRLSFREGNATEKELLGTRVRDV